jgi:hypothetical protein
MNSTAKIAPQQASDRRANDRVATALAGKFCVPDQKIILDCEVINLSGGGASVRCAEPPQLNTLGVLYIEGLGRFECVTTRCVKGLLGLRFVCKEAKRQRLLRDLATYVTAGMAGIARLRRDPRNASTSRCYFNRPCGEIVYCDVLDISLQEVFLRTKSRPPIGEIVNLGRTCGRVKRHNPDGIAIQFLELVASPGAEDGG